MVNRDAHQSQGNTRTRGAGGHRRQEGNSGHTGHQTLKQKSIRQKYHDSKAHINQSHRARTPNHEFSKITSQTLWSELESVQSH